MNPIQPPPPMTYQHLQVENEYLKHNLSYAQHVGTYNQSVAQANFHDAQRWRKFKEMLSVKQGAEKIDQLEKHVDAALTYEAESRNQSVGAANSRAIIK